ncbi:hypothetical protein K402DRAFT_423315 [Aulographum hederae CBS 113979]|uniref:Uncharacterized protein n=1 Tax=Aulographum hederae CBS 113979 TaxID=1176131 RepID=A0A6G1GST9_9PEZI|nr:hypothetical protein K402DRAFT_423315 [Aulographum hederae CBS 113979]
MLFGLVALQAAAVLASPVARSAPVARDLYIPSDGPVPAPAAFGNFGLKFVDRTEGKPKYNPKAKRATLKYGPLTIVGKNEAKPVMEGMSMDPKGQAGIRMVSDGLPKDSTILSAHYELLNPDGSISDPSKLYIHHFTSMTPKQAKAPIGFCFNQNANSDRTLPFASFADRGEDSGATETVFTAANSSVVSGFHMRAQDMVMIQWDVVNYEPTPVDIYVALTVEYLEGIQGLDAGATLKSVGGCGVGGPKLDKSGPSSTVSAKMPILADTQIIWARGHLHAGGDSMDLLVNDKVVCTSVAQYDNDGVIENMTLCPKPIQLKKGDTLQVSSLYDLAKHPLRKSTGDEGHSHGGSESEAEGDAHGEMEGMEGMEGMEHGGASDGATTVLGGEDVMGMFAITYTVNPQ